MLSEDRGVDAVQAGKYTGDLVDRRQRVDFAWHLRIALGTRDSSERIEIKPLVASSPG